MELNSDFPVKIQFVPSHKSIKGNEIADTAAKEAHGICSFTRFSLSLEEMVRITKKHFFK